MAKLRGYFDESGIHAGSSACVVAGLVSKKPFFDDLAFAWNHFIRTQWKIEYFHATEFANRQGQFEGWSDNHCFIFTTEAIKLLREGWKGWPEHGFSVFGTGISVAAFLERTEDERRWLTGGVMSRLGKWRKQGAPTKPYFLAFQQIVLDAVKLTQDCDAMGRHKQTGEVVDFVFDQQRAYESTARGILATMRSANYSVSDRIGNIAFSSKLRAVPLQVADFIAYESHRYLRIRNKREKMTPTAKHLDPLFGGEIGESEEDGVGDFLQQLGHWWRSVYFDRDTIQDVLDYCPPEPHKRFKLPDPIDMTRFGGDVRLK